MAKLHKLQSSSFELPTLAPRGTFSARCLDVRDLLHVRRPKFGDPSEMEMQNVTRFLFDFTLGGQRFCVQTREFRISGSLQSHLVQFLTDWLGHPPEDGFDYCELKGHPAKITVVHRDNRQGTTKYANITGIAPTASQPPGIIPDQPAPTPAPPPNTQVLHHGPPLGAHPHQQVPSTSVDAAGGGE